jgi:protease-4
MGLSVEEPFLGDTLSRFRVQAQFEAREEFKSFADIFTQRGFTAANREQLQSVLTSLYDSMIATIAADRELTPEAARAAIEATPITGEQAVQAHLVDRLGQPESAAQSARDRAGENTELVEFSAYMATPQHGPKTIAVVLGEGEILGGTGEDSFFGDEQLMLGDDVAEALLDASEDKDVAAIIFRVSSPGGSVVASDQILAALRTARARGKPVIVSMGDVAASGGYYVSAEANEIVANPTTITGSIGVVGGKFVFGPALEHYLSMHSDSLVVGSPLVTMFSADTPFTPAGRTAFSGFIDRAYQEFMTRVATGRRLTVAQVREIARGRIWTGAQAKERRLVDHLGGFSTALARARAHARIGANERVTLKFFPEQKSPFEELQQLFGASAESARAAVVLGTILGDDRVEALLRATQEDRARMRARMEDVEVR